MITAKASECHSFGNDDPVCRHSAWAPKQSFVTYTTLAIPRELMVGVAHVLVQSQCVFVAKQVDRQKLL